MNNLELIKQAAFQRGFQKQAMFGVGKSLGNIPWKEGVGLGTMAMPTTAGYGALLGALGNVALGDEDQAVAERLIKGLLYGAGTGAAASVPIGIAGMTTLDKTIGTYLRRMKAKKELMAASRGVNTGAN
jgi:hypothetical protein